MTDSLLTPRMQIFAVLVLLALLGWVTKLVRNHRLSLRDSLLWQLSTFAALLVALFPRLLFWTARALQVEVPANALFTLTFLYVLVNLLSINIAVSNGAMRVRRLAQECALLRAELQRLQTATDPPASALPHERGAVR